MSAYGNMMNQIATNSIPVNNCPLNRIAGASSVGQFVDSMPTINSVVIKNYNMGINDGGSVFGGCGCGGISPYENAYSYNIKAMNDVSWGETAGAAGKMLMFNSILNPSQGLSLLATGGSLFGNLAGAGGKAFEKLGGWLMG